MATRILYDSLLTSPSLAACSPRAQDAFPRLILLADDFGCFEANPRILLGRGWPLRPDTTEADVAGWLEEFGRARPPEDPDAIPMAVFWSEGGRRYGFLTGWFGERGQRKREEYSPTNPKGSRRKTPPPPANLLERRSRAGNPNFPPEPAREPTGKPSFPPLQSQSHDQSHDQSHKQHLSAGADHNAGQQPLLDVVSSPASDSPTAFQALWNETAHPDLPRWKAMTPKRRQAATARLRGRRLRGDDGSFQAVIRRINTTGFCLGENKTGWRANPDWLLQPDTADKVLEGKYDRPGERVEGTGPPRRPAPKSEAERQWFEVIDHMRDVLGKPEIARQLDVGDLRPRIERGALVITQGGKLYMSWVRGEYGELLEMAAAEKGINLLLEDQNGSTTHTEPEAEDGHTRVSRAAG